MNIYNYSSANDFVNAPSVSLTLLSDEIRDSSIGSTFENVLRSGDQIAIHFKTALSALERGELDTVVVGHEGVSSPYQILETVALSPLNIQVNNTTEWQELGGILASPLDFGTDITELKAQVTGLYKGEGSGMELNVVEKGEWNQLADTDIINPALSLNSTGGAWAPFTVYSNIQVRPGFWSYVVQGRCGQAVDMFMRHLSLSVVKAT